MSHFSVLVITDSPDEDTIAEALAPYQENNMGDCPEEFMEFHDQEDIFAREYADDGMDLVVDPEGNFYLPWDAQFQRDALPDEVAAYRAALSAAGSDRAARKAVDDAYPNYKTHGYGANERLVIRNQFPVGWAHGWVPFNVRYATLEEFAEDYHGHASRDEKTGRYGFYENPSAKWDWWAIGGRWSAAFAPPGYDPTEDPANWETCFLCGGTGLRCDELGEKQRAEDPNYKCNGCDVPNHPGKRLKHAPQWRQVGNQVQVKDLDMPARIADAQKRHGERWDQLQNAYELDPVEGYPSYVEARRAYRDKVAELIAGNDGSNGEFKPLYQLIEADPVLTALRDKVGENWLRASVPQEFVDRQAYVEAVAPISSFAVLKDGEWFEKGQMGWFGMSTDEMTDAQWSKRITELVTGLPPETWLTIVDCHI